MSIIFYLFGSKDTKDFPFHLFHYQISYHFLLKKNKSLFPLFEKHVNAVVSRAEKS